MLSLAEDAREGPKGAGLASAAAERHTREVGVRSHSRNSVGGPRRGRRRPPSESAASTGASASAGSWRQVGTGCGGTRPGAPLGRCPSGCCCEGPCACASVGARGLRVLGGWWHARCVGAGRRQVAWIGRWGTSCLWRSGDLPTLRRTSDSVGRDVGGRSAAWSGPPAKRLRAPSVGPQSWPALHDRARGRHLRVRASCRGPRAVAERAGSPNPISC